MASIGGDEGPHPPGTLDEAIYQRQLSGPRFFVRSAISRQIQLESEVIAGWQTKYRSTILDKWFQLSSLLGTTSFFVSTVPLFFFFGHAEYGRGLLYVLGWSGYVSSLFKDLLCIPRPYSPPVIRLTTAFHHLEYGMPSTHSANCISAALFLYSIASTLEVSVVNRILINLALVVYASSVVLGRIYCGMHSVSDCIVGGTIGVFTWILIKSLENTIESWLVNPSYGVPMTIIGTLILLISQHPSTVERCLCFDDAIACLSSMAGVSVGRWFATTVDLPPQSVIFYLYPPSQLVYGGPKVVIGVGTLLLWRSGVKATLPGPARWLFGGNSASKIPSPRSEEPTANGAITSSSTISPAKHLTTPRKRKSSGQGDTASTVDTASSEELAWSKPFRFQTSEVVVKVVVYFGIGWLGSEIMPFVFGRLGWA